MANIIVELGRKFAACKVKYEAAKKLADEANEEWGAAEAELMEAMIEGQTKSITIDGIGRLTLRRQNYPSVNAANKPLFFEYLKASGHGDLLKLDVHAATLQKFLKEHKDELSAQVQSAGLSEHQAECLQNVEQFSGIKAGQKFDEMEAGDVVEAILKVNGAAMFSKSDISLTKV